MANTAAAFGAQDYMHQGGSQRTEELEQVWIPSSHTGPIYNGDLVRTSTYTIASGGYGTYIWQGSSQAGVSYVRGVFRGCEYFNSALQRPVYSRWWPGSGLAGTSSATGDARAWIVSDPNMYFVMACSSATTLLSSNAGASLTLGQAGSTGFNSSDNGSAATGLSGLQVVGVGASPLSTAAFDTNAFRLVDWYSNRAAGNWLNLPGFGSNSVVNGTDPTSVSAWVIVQPLAWENKFP